MGTQNSIFEENGQCFLKALNEGYINDEPRLLRIFKNYPADCELNRTDKNGILPLTFIIHREMAELANAILNYYEKNDKDLSTILQATNAHRLNYLNFKTLNIFKYSPLMTAINSRTMSSIALRLLKYPKLCGLEKIDDKFNAFKLACERQEQDVALKILESVIKSQLTHINKNGDTVLRISILNRLPDVSMKILKDPKLCGLDIINKSGNTILMDSNSRGLSSISMKMLKHPELCKLSIVDKYGENAFMIGVRNELTDVSLKILKHNVQYARCVNNKGTNALMLAIENGMISVATEILTLDNCYPYDHVDNNGNTALMLALRNRLLKVALLLCDKIDKPYLCTINNCNESALSIAIDNDLCYVAYLIYDTCAESSHNLTLNQLEKLTKIKENYKKL